MNVNFRREFSDLEICKFANYNSSLCNLFTRKSTHKNWQLKNTVTNFILRILIIFTFLSAKKMFCSGLQDERFRLTSEERGELARKFKYYHESVRPTERFNLVQNANGTYFALNAELEILQTRSDIDDDRKFHVELLLIIHYNDDRLFLRELPDVIHIPDEFRAWTPTVELADGFGSGTTVTGGSDLTASPSSTVFALQKSIHLDPKTGQITVFHRISGSVNCFSDAWKYPFERFSCEIEFLTEQNERLFLRIVRDLRINAQRQRVRYSVEEWPNLVARFDFGREWLFAVVDVYLPSTLLFSVALFAQWKRRKVQVLVTVGSILCIILIKNAQDNSLLQRMGSRLYRHHYQTTGTVTLQDVWLIGLLIHLVCILTVDLLLPSRRIVYSTSPLTGKLKAKSTSLVENLQQKFANSPKRRTAMPYISDRKRLSASNATLYSDKASCYVTVEDLEGYDGSAEKQVRFQAQSPVFDYGSSQKQISSENIIGRPTVVRQIYYDDPNAEDNWNERKSLSEDEINSNNYNDENQKQDDTVEHSSREKIWKPAKHDDDNTTGILNFSYSSDNLKEKLQSNSASTVALYLNYDDNSKISPFVGQKRKESYSNPQYNPTTKNFQRNEHFVRKTPVRLPPTVHMKYVTVSNKQTTQTSSNEEFSSYLQMNPVNGHIANCRYHNQQYHKQQQQQQLLRQQQLENQQEQLQQQLQQQLRQQQLRQQQHQEQQLRNYQDHFAYSNNNSPPSYESRQYLNSQQNLDLFRSKQNFRQHNSQKDLCHSPQYAMQNAAEQQQSALSTANFHNTTTPQLAAYSIPNLDATRPPLEEPPMKRHFSMPGIQSSPYEQDLPYEPTLGKDRVNFNAPNFQFMRGGERGSATWRDQNFATYNSASMGGKTPRVDRVTVGRKKQIALSAILICFVAFVCAYLALTIYAVCT